MMSAAPGQASKMAYLHHKRLNFIEKCENESKQVGPTLESNSILKYIDCIRNRFWLKYFCVEVMLG